MSIVIALSVWLALGVALYLVVRGGQPSLQTIDEFEKLVVPVDIEAFSILMSEELSLFISSKLRKEDQRTAKRIRKQAAVGYVAIMASNAALLIRATEMARLSADPSVQEHSRRLQALAIKLRIYSLITLMKLQVEHLLPVGIDSRGLVTEYGLFKDSFLVLTSAIHSRRMSTLQEAWKQG